MQKVIPGYTLDLPRRTKKPRKFGLTSVMDTGRTVGELRHMLEDFRELIDIAKIGVGTAYLAPRLYEKLALYRGYGVITCFGGTLFEKFYHQNKLEDYMLFLQHFEVEWVEVSSGTIEMEIDELVAAIEKLGYYFNVIAEVGHKDPKHAMNPMKWADSVEACLNAGAKYVILEGRTSGDIGLYNEDGSLFLEMIEAVLSRTGPDKLIFEAPTPHNQNQLISLLGPNVNLGNIPMRAIVLLESQRQGLRSETFFLQDNENERGHWFSL
jgi:phosphosulfolactate synthase